jgi:hypothetical protein
MTWQSVGTHTFMPTDTAVQIGSFDLAAGQDTIWVRITQLNDPADWPFSYGILSWRNANGSPLGSIKAYSNRFGEVFRLGNGLPPSDGTGSIWFEPRGFNLGWLKAGFPWELQFEAQAGASDVTSGYWDRDSVNKVITPKTQGDNLDMGTGWIKAANLVITDGPGANDSRDAAGFQQGFWTPSPTYGSCTPRVEGCWFARCGQLVTLHLDAQSFTDTTTSSPLALSDLPYPFDVASDSSQGTARLTRADYPIGAVTHAIVNGPEMIFQYQSAVQPGYSLLHDQLAGNTRVVAQVCYLTDDTRWSPA